MLLGGMNLARGKLRTHLWWCLRATPFRKFHPFAAGIDIGSRFYVVAVSPDLADQPVQTFQAFTSDLLRRANWLVATGTKTVVMESTGVYWGTAYEVLESQGLEVVLANAREARAVPGRKSDVNDAQWL